MKTTVLKLAAAVAFFAAVSPASAAVNLITNGSFELPDLNGNPTFGPNATNNNLPAYIYPGGAGPSTVDDWTYNAGTGLINTNVDFNAWYASNLPTGFDGKQFAFVQGGDTSTLTQTFISSGTGLTSVAWLAAGRPNMGPDGNQLYEVLLNNVSLGIFTTFSGENFTPFNAIGALVAGVNTLQFKGLTTEGDHTSFIDSVAVSAVPELSTWGMMLLGFAGLGFVTYRRARKTSVAA